MKKIYLLTLFCSILALQASAQCPGACTYVASSQAVGSTTNVAITKPTGVAPNDVMIAAIHSGWCNGSSAVTPPAGWILINNTSNTGSGCGSGNTTIQLSTFYKIATAAEPSTYTFTGSTTQMYVGGIVAYSNVNIVSPINASSNLGLQDSCGTIKAPGVTTTATCTRLVNVFICSVNFSGMNIIPQASLTERLDVGTTGNHPWGNENLEISDELFMGMGATGDRTAGLSGCSSTGWVTGGQMIALTCTTTAGIGEDLLSNSYLIAPNPSSGIFEISMQEKNAPVCKMEIFDCVGKIIKVANILEQKTTIDLTSSPKGMYFIKLSSEKGTLVRKIVVE